MKIKDFLEILEDESWQMLGVRVPYDLRKEAKDAGFVESVGKTNGQQWHITNAGVAELQRLRAEANEGIDLPEPDESAAVSLANVPNVYTKTVAARMTALADTAIVDGLPVTPVLVESAVGTAIVGRNLVAEIEQLRADMARDSQILAVVAKMAEDDEHHGMTVTEYVASLRQERDNETAIVDGVNSLAAADDMAEMSPAEYVQWLRDRVEELEAALRQRNTQYDAVYAAMKADHTPYENIADYVEDLRGCRRRQDADLQAANHSLALVDQLRRDDDHEDMSLDDYITTLFAKQKSIDDLVSEYRLIDGILSELSRANPDIRVFVDCRKMAFLKLAAIARGGVK